MNQAPPLQVMQFPRRAHAHNYSVERLFADVRSAMPEDIQINLRINRFPSNGLFARIYDAVCVWRQRGPVNHVLGDVQYLAWFLPRNRTISGVLDCISLERLFGLRRWTFWLLWYWWPMRRSGYVTVISEFSRDALLRWVPNRDRPRLLQVGTTPNRNLIRVIEAQTVGRPEVAGNVCSMPEAAGGAACMVDPFDIDDIRRGICRLLEDPDCARTLVHNGFESARRFTPERIAEAYVEVYRLVAKI